MTKCMYVYNPKSGRQNNSKNKEYILKKLKTKFDVVDFKATTKRGDAGIFAREACGEYDVFVVSGGDGTMNEVVNALANMPNRPKVGYIPTGTTNDLAHSLGIPKSIKRAVKIILEGKYVSHDIFRINDSYAIYVCCFGLFTKSSYDTSQKEKKHFGRLAYFRYGIKEIFESKSIKVKLTYDDKVIEDKYMLGIVGNSRYIAGYKIDKKALFDDGLLDIMLIKDSGRDKISLRGLLRIVRVFLFGKGFFYRNKNCTILSLSKFKLDLPKETIINLDGEKSDVRGSLEFEVLDKHIDIFVKR